MSPNIRGFRLALALIGDLAVPSVAREDSPDAPWRSGDLPQSVTDLQRVLPAPLPAPGHVAYLGLMAARSADALRVVRVFPGSPVHCAGVRSGDVLEALGGSELNAEADLAAALDQLAPGDTAQLRVRRAGEVLRRTVTLGTRRAPDTAWRRPRFRLAVVPLLFGDDETACAPAAELKRLFLTRTNRRGIGASVADYLHEQSFGAFELEGAVLAPVKIRRQRAHYADQLMGGRAGSAFHAAAAKIAKRGDLDGFDGMAFLVSGPAEKRPGLALWPHRSDVGVAGRRLPYFVHTHTGGDAGIGGHCHEFGHLLGLDDEYGIGHRTGSGDFCLMALGHRGGQQYGDRVPFSLCAPCRVRLGWLRPVVLDPRDRRRVRLPPVGEGPRNVLMLPLDRRSSEYLLLEVRARTDFDAELPSAGLLVWHIGGDGTPGQGPYRQRVDLLEAHGIDTFDAALVRPTEIAFPTARARDLTPGTSPGVPTAVGRFPVYLTDLVRTPSGPVTLTLGRHERVLQAPPAPYVPTASERDGAVIRRDPITGRDVRFYPNRLRLTGLPKVRTGDDHSSGER